MNQAVAPHLNLCRPWALQDDEIDMSPFKGHGCIRLRAVQLIDMARHRPMRRCRRFDERASKIGVHRRYYGSRTRRLLWHGITATPLRFLLSVLRVTCQPRSLALLQVPNGAQKIGYGFYIASVALLPCRRKFFPWQATRPADQKIHWQQAYGKGAARYRQNFFARQTPQARRKRLPWSPLIAKAKANCAAASGGSALSPLVSPK